MLFVSNTAKQLLLTIDIHDSLPAAKHIFLDNILLDDFAIGANGTIYACTHIFNSVVKITADKQISIVAGEDQGLTGSTAVMFGITEHDKNSLYVTTNGGISKPGSGGLEDGKIIKIDL